MRFRLSTATEVNLSGHSRPYAGAWRRDQWLAYRGALAAAFERIAAEPPPRRFSPPGCARFLAGRM